MTDQSEDRQRLASGLRALRVEAGLSTTELAGRLGCSQSKVSKTERGQTLPDPADVESWASVTEADPELRDELVAIAERAGAQATEWRRELAPGRRRLQEEIQRLEENSSVVRVFAIDVVVGLAQTRAYAEAMFRLDRPVVPPDEVAEIVEARLARQAVLADPTKQFSLLMSEMALRRRLVSSSEMRAQVKRLIVLSKRPNVGVGVIPFDADERAHQLHGFAVLGEPEVDAKAIVLAETVTRALTVRSAAEVAEYIAHFDALRSAALEGDQLREFLAEFA